LNQKWTKTFQIWVVYLSGRTIQHGEFIKLVSCAETIVVRAKDICKYSP